MDMKKLTVQKKSPAANIYSYFFSFLDRRETHSVCKRKFSHGDIDSSSNEYVYSMYA